MLRRTAFATLTSLALATASFAATAADQVFSNTAAILIPGAGSVGPANPYPSNIAVSGVTGNVTAVKVTLTNLSHTYPDDIDIILQAPSGQQMLLMSDSGGVSTISNVTLQFSSAAGSSLADSGQIVSGTYLPTNFDTTTTEAISNTDLTIFNGPATGANGVWSLFVVDDVGGDVGAMNGGWTLNISDAPDTTCASEGYIGAKLTWCKNICENGLTGQVLDTWIHRWISRYRVLPYCAVEDEGQPE